MRPLPRDQLRRIEHGNTLAGVRRFAAGEAIAWRSVWRDEGVVGTVWPAIVVADTDDLIALYRPVGTHGKQRSGERGGPRGRLLLHWDGGYQDLEWHSVNVLTLYRPGDMHSVWRAWRSTTGDLAWRYVNLEEPWQRTAIGFDSKDLYLDLWSEPDGSKWRWKDEDELAWMVAHGRVTPEQSSVVRAEGERALIRISRREPPHDRDWDQWKADPAWPIPALPANWRSFQADGSVRVQRAHRP